ncbi:antibiotic biosynthesis monooxygenase [Desulfovibrio sp. OttesenSCG-928-G15]|nr:antibiotic biosynthesis monooxygenase [Desulfovibrio sp. OttesenSCG-928-G15]
MYALSVMFTIAPQYVDAFKKAAMAQAENSLANEKGCIAFSVFQEEGKPERFYFHEVYTDKAALDDVHNKTEYLANFREAIEGMVVERAAHRWVKS